MIVSQYQEISRKFPNTFIEKNPCIRGPEQFKPVLFKGQLHKERITSIGNFTRRGTHYSHDGPTEIIISQRRHPQNRPLPALLPTEAPGGPSSYSRLSRETAPWVSRLACGNDLRPTFYIYRMTTAHKQRLEAVFPAHSDEWSDHTKILSKHNTWFFIKAHGLAILALLSEIFPKYLCVFSCLAGNQVFHIASVIPNDQLHKSGLVPQAYNSQNSDVAHLWKKHMDVIRTFATDIR